MTNQNDKIERLSSFELLFAFPILANKDKVQIFDKYGQIYVGFIDSIQEITKNNSAHTLCSLGDNVWIDKTFWSDDKNDPGKLLTLYALGGFANLAIEEVLMVVQKGSVYTFFTERGLFLMPATKKIRTLLAVDDDFEYEDKIAWRKGMDPETIQNRIFQKSLEVVLK